MYDAGALLLTLVFDRAVNIDFFDGSAVLVYDGSITAQTYDGTSGAVLSDPVTIVVTLTAEDPYVAADVTMTASIGAGIVSADGGLPWVGCTNLVLPFP